MVLKYRLFLTQETKSDTNGTATVLSLGVKSQVALGRKFLLGIDIFEQNFDF